MTTKKPEPPRARTPRRHATARTTVSGNHRKGPQPFSADELSQIGTDIATYWFNPIESSSLTLMEIDPWNIHAYWNIDTAEIARARARLPGKGRDAVLLLRFTDISPRLDGTAPHEQFDIEVNLASTNWYVNLWRDARHYSAELGLRGAEGAFISLLRSNVVATPRAGPSPELDFRELEIRAPRAVEPSQATNESGISDILLSNLFPKRLQHHDDFPLAIAAAGHSGLEIDEPVFPRLNEATTETELDEFQAEFATELATERGLSDSGTAIAVAEEPSGHFPVIAAAEIAPYHELARQTRRQVLAGTPLPPLPPISLDTIALTDVELIPQPLPIPPAMGLNDSPDREARGDAATANTPLPAASTDSTDASDVTIVATVAGRPAVRLPVPLEALLADAVFSSWHGDAPARASAQVVIEGQAAPDTCLTIFDKRVLLRVDGSFTLRLPLQQGPELAALLHHLRGRYGEWVEG